MRILGLAQALLQVRARLLRSPDRLPQGRRILRGKGFTLGPEVRQPRLQAFAIPTKGLHRDPSGNRRLGLTRECWQLVRNRLGRCQVLAPDDRGLVEAGQAGIFQLQNIPEQDIEPILSVACPNILFPYARETISNLVNRAGFPPMLLSPVNFEAIYQQRLMEQQQQTHQSGEIPIQ